MSAHARHHYWLLGLLVAVAFAPGRTNAATVLPVSGARFDAELLAVSAAGQVTFQTAEARRTMPLADLVRWGTLAEPQHGAQIVLNGGGLVVVDAVRIENEQLHIESELLGERTIPLEFLAGIVFQPPRDKQESDRLAQRVLDRSARSDRLLLENGDELSGAVASIDDKTVTIDSQGQKLKIELSRIAALAFDPTLSAPAQTQPNRTLVGLRDGSRVSVGELIASDREVQLTMPDKTVWKLPADAIVFLQPLSGKAKYLSDMTAEGYRHLPFLSQAWPYRNDANVAGTQLRAGGHPHAKGIGMHSAARLTYRLDKRFRRFAADAALDDQVGDGGACVFGVYVDDKLAWKSDMIRGGMQPVPVEVDVEGAKRLSLIVEFGERGDELDRANWLDARLIE